MGKGALIAAWVVGVLVGAGGATAFPASKKAEPKHAEPIAKEDRGPEDEDALAANANLVRSLAECNKRLGDLGQKRVEAPVASASAEPERGRRGRGRNAEPVDWEKHAQEGTVPYRIPCLRDTPFTPPQRVIDRLGLAPQDVDVLKDAYKASNARVMATLVPACAEVVGSKEIAEKIGAQACMNAVMDGARKASPEKTKEALTRVAEVNAGKRQPAAGGPPIETLMLALSKEQKAFEADLAAKLGPEEAARLANARGLCTERGVAGAERGGGF